MPPIPDEQQSPYGLGAPGTLLLTIPEAFAELRVSRSKFYGLIAAKKLPLVKIDGSSRVRRSDLEAYVEALPTFDSRAVAGGNDPSRPL